MSKPKAPKAPPPMQAPVQIDDSQVVAARDETVRRARGRGFLGTILTGFQAQSSGPGGLKQILG